jgi:hypothetical protein
MRGLAKKNWGNPIRLQFYLIKEWNNGTHISGYDIRRLPANSPLESERLALKDHLAPGANDPSVYLAGIHFFHFLPFKSKFHKCGKPPISARLFGQNRMVWINYKSL